MTERQDGITDAMDMSFSKLQEVVKGREAWSSAVHGVTKSRTHTHTHTHTHTKELDTTEQLNNTLFDVQRFLI